MVYCILGLKNKIDIFFLETGISTRIWTFVPIEDDDPMD